MEKPRNLLEMSCNGWRSPATCGRYPATDVEAPQPAEMSCNGWRSPTTCGR